jgi:hypothetical protein
MLVLSFFVGTTVAIFKTFVEANCVFVGYFILYSPCQTNYIWSSFETL